MTTAQALRQVFANHGREVTVEHCERTIERLRETFGVLFSAADVEWNEERLIHNVDLELTERGWPPGSKHHG